MAIVAFLFLTPLFIYLFLFFIFVYWKDSRMSHMCLCHKGNCANLVFEVLYSLTRFDE